MKRCTWAPSAVALVTFALFAVWLPAQYHNPNGELPSGVVTLGQPSRGVAFKTAAINGIDGSVANCFGCNKARTVRLSTGNYQVTFDENVQATNGWSRWVQADTLTTGSEDAWCNTADRAGNTDAIFVNCQREGGSGSAGNSVFVDTSFFIFAAR